MQKNIVVCDDDTWTRDFVSQFLADLNYIVHSFENGEKAFKFLSAKSADLVITDIKMPVMTGIELIEQMFLAKLKIPTIFLTAVLDPNEIIQAYSFNYFEYINKPISPFDLRDSVEKALKFGYQETMFSDGFVKRMQKK